MGPIFALLIFDVFRLGTSMQILQTSIQEVGLTQKFDFFLKGESIGFTLMPQFWLGIREKKSYEHPKNTQNGTHYGTYFG